MPTQKSAGVAAVLSFFISGLGQIYNGHFFKGIHYSPVINGALTAILIGYIFLPIVWLFAITDAQKCQ